ncbi:MAG TPA: hypothetical protein VK842_08010, partial [bacterium]|nr:hypothetical protein [bacterium]
MADREEGRAQRIYDDMIAEEAAPASGLAAPVLPRLRLTVPSSKAPLSIRHKAPAASAPLPAAAQLIPEILKQVDAARRAQSAARAKARNSAAPPSAGPVPAPAPPAPAASDVAGLRNSRVAWRYALVFGRRVDRVWKGRQRSEDASLDSRAIFSPDTQHHPVPSHAWDRPGWTAWAFLLPALAVFLLFNWLPLLRGLAASFQQVSLVGQSHWVGLDNYARAMGDPQVWDTFGHALLLCALSLALGFWLPVALAIYSNELKRGQGLLRTALFLPFLTPAVPA